MNIEVKEFLVVTNQFHGTEAKKCNELFLITNVPSF